MSDRNPPAEDDPHAEYRRQAAAHFGAHRDTPSKGAAQEGVPNIPRIARLPSDTGEAATKALPADTANTRRLLDESRQRFAAGTTYTGPGRSWPPAARPAASGPPPPPVPRPRSVPPPPAPSVPPPPANPPFDTNQSAGSILFDLKPYHALRFLTALWVVVALIFLPGIGFWLTAVGCAVGEWYTRTNRIGWPADVEEALVRRRLATPGEQVRTAPSEPVIPFRAMTIPELFAGAFKVVLKNWPALLGIPLVILVCFVVIFGAVMMTIMQIMSSASSVMSGGLFLSSVEGSIVSLLVMMFVFFAITLALALPADALLIALTVTATDKALRGVPVRFGEVFRLAHKRILAVCRLTLTFYAMFVVPEFLITALASLVLGPASPAYLVVILLSFLVFFALGILLSLSPIVLVVEDRGVIESLKRSIQLAKPAWGRLLAIHLLWSACVVPLLVVSFVIMFNPVLYAVAIAGLIAYVRTLQMLIYVDLRMRQEDFDRELLADWTRNTGREGLPTA